MVQVPPDTSFQKRVQDILDQVGEGDWSMGYDRTTQLFNISGTPEMNLQFEDPNNPDVWIDVPDGTPAVIPGTVPSGGPEIISFRVQNLGGASLDLTGGITPVGETGMTGAPAYGAIAPDTVLKGAIGLFTATITGTGPGGGSFDFDVANDDPNEDPYNALITLTFS